MSNTEGTPEEPAWKPTVPFSEREHSSHPAEPLFPPSMPFAARIDHAEVEVTTAPIPVTSETTRTESRELKLLDPEQLTADEFYQLRLRMTAYYHALKLLAADERNAQRVDQPGPYQERFYVWKMVFKESWILAITVVVIAVITAVKVFLPQGGEAGAWFAAMIIGTVVAFAWTAYRTYYTWHHTVIFCTPAGTGVRQKRNRWLLLNEREESVDTSSIQTKDATRGTFASFFNLNCWRVNLDSPSQKDAFLNNLRFVRDGNRLMQTVEATQRYLKSER